MPFIAIRILARVFSLMIISVLIDCCVFMFTCGLTTGNHGDIEAAGIFLGARELIPLLVCLALVKCSGALGKRKQGKKDVNARKRSRNNRRRRLDEQDTEEKTTTGDDDEYFDAECGVETYSIRNIEDNAEIYDDERVRVETREDNEEIDEGEGRDDLELRGEEKDNEKITADTTEVYDENVKHVNEGYKVKAKTRDSCQEADVREKRNEGKLGGEREKRADTTEDTDGQKVNGGGARRREREVEVSRDRTEAQEDYIGVKVRERDMRTGAGDRSKRNIRKPISETILTIKCDLGMPITVELLDKTGKPVTLIKRFVTTKEDVPNKTRSERVKPETIEERDEREDTDETEQTGRDEAVETGAEREAEGVEEERVAGLETGSEREAEEERVADTETETGREAEEERVVDLETGTEREAEEERVADTETKTEREAEEERVADVETEAEREAEEERVVDMDIETEREAEEERVVDLETGTEREAEEERVVDIETVTEREAEEERAETEREVDDVEEERAIDNEVAGDAELIQETENIQEVESDEDSGVVSGAEGQVYKAKSVGELIQFYNHWFKNN